MRAALLIMVVFITVTALPAGLLLMLEPTGSTSGLNVQLLSNTPFKDFFIPGLILALIVGGLNVISLFMVMNQNSWAYRMAMTGGIVLVLWVIAELVLMPHYDLLQIIYLMIGMLIILTSYQLMGKAVI